MKYIKLGMNSNDEIFTGDEICRLIEMAKSVDMGDITLMDEYIRGRLHLYNEDNWEDFPLTLIDIYYTHIPRLGRPDIMKLRREFLTFVFTNNRPLWEAMY